MKLREGFSKKDGKPYSFYGCSNYPACMKTLPNPDNNTAPNTSKAPQIAPQSVKTQDNNEVVTLLKQILAELRNINKFPEPEEKLPFEGDEDISKYV